LLTERDNHKARAIEEYQQQRIVSSPLPSPQPQHQAESQKPAMVSLRIEGGKKNKLRATDILGALTSNKQIAGASVGKIDIYDFHSFVAIEREQIEAAYHLLTASTIKGRMFKVKKVAS
jgi:ATP-independent RNA helicase DbpA